MAAERPPAEGPALIRDLVALGGAGLLATEVGVPPPMRGPGSILVGVDDGQEAPEGAFEAYDILLTERAGAPAPWITVPDIGAAIDGLHARVREHPVASAVLAQVLRTNAALGFETGLQVESLAYSALLASGEFRAWRAARPVRTVDADADAQPRVAVRTVDRVFEIALSRPGHRNAVDAPMRDALCEALEAAAMLHDGTRVRLRGEGPDFSAGGDLDEFGQTADVAIAHLIRTLRSPARLLHALGERAEAVLHGACIGAGIEVPAAAACVVAIDGARFRLPEVGMGLIPGAGGTVTIPRRIGRWRTCFMALSGLDIDLKTAMAWGLVDRRG